MPAKWVLPLEKSLSNWLTPRTAALEQDMLFGHYVSKHYHQGNRMEVSAPDALVCIITVASGLWCRGSSVPGCRYLLGNLFLL